MTGRCNDDYIHVHAEEMDANSQQMLVFLAAIHDILQIPSLAPLILTAK